MKFDREMEETTKKTSMEKLAQKSNAAACCSINAAALVKLMNLRSNSIHALKSGINLI